MRGRKHPTRPLRFADLAFRDPLLHHQRWNRHARTALRVGRVKSSVGIRRNEDILHQHEGSFEVLTLLFLLRFCSFFRSRSLHMEPWRLKVPDSQGLRRFGRNARAFVWHVRASRSERELLPGGFFVKKLQEKRAENSWNCRKLAAYITYCLNKHILRQ